MENFAYASPASVKDAAGMDFAKAGHVVAHSYDGLNRD